MYPGLNGGNYADGFVYNYFNAAWALVQGLTKSGGALGAKLQASMPRKLKSGVPGLERRVVQLDSHRQAIQDQYQLQLVKNADGSIGPQVVGFVPAWIRRSAVSSSRRARRPAARSLPCKKREAPWQGKIQVVKNGVITNQVIK